MVSRNENLAENDECPRAGPLGAARDHLGPPGTTWDHLGSHGSNRVPRDHSAPLPPPHILSVTLGCHQLHPPPLAIPAMSKLRHSRPCRRGVAAALVAAAIVAAACAETRRHSGCRLSAQCTAHGPRRAMTNACQCRICHIYDILSAMSGLSANVIPGVNETRSRPARDSPPGPRSR